MEFGERPLGDAEGALLAHAVTLGGRRVAKGTRIDRTLLEAARAEGLERLWVARPGPHDVPEAEAAAELGAALAGPGVEARPPVHGRVNIHATADGLLLFDPCRLDAANRATEAVGIATRPPFAPVAAGELVATVKVIPYAVEPEALAAVAAAGARLEVRPWRTGQRACLVTTIRAGEDTGGGKLEAKTAAVTRERLARLGMALDVAAPVPHAVAPLAAALAAAEVDLVLVAGATATADRADVIPAAITAAGGVVERVGMPVDPGNLLVLGRIAERPVVGLPGCARSPKRNGLDLVLERLAAGLPVTSELIAGMGVGGLLEESGRPVPWGWNG